ncbi:MAG: hypothetical protein EPO61_02980 [Nitrospirae bacterium]|nr:MAG: hypothetical protein EPO61_02980 [Nitrospirota bacterium]
MLTNLIVAIGLVGSIASIIGILIAAPGWKSKTVHVSYGLLVTVLATGVFSYQTQLSELTQIENQVERIVKSADLSTDGSQRGFMLASLAFLEKHKDRFPETFARAKSLCDNVGVTESKQESALERMYQGWRLTDGATAMKYLLSGIAAGSGD